MDNHKVGYVHDGLEPDRQSAILTLDLSTRLKLVVDMAPKWRYIDSGYFAVHFGKKSYIQWNFSGSNTDGSFTTAISNSFLSP